VVGEEREVRPVVVAFRASAHAAPGPRPSWKLFQMWEPVRYTARSSPATVK
jgi:hypothetical protein